MKPTFRPHHEAVRDTMWVGKGSGPLAWLMIAGVIVLACLLAWWLH